MNFEFSDITKKRSAVILCAVLSVVSGTLGSFFGELFLAPTVALLAALFLFESGDKRIFSFIAPSLIVIINVFIGGFFSVLGIGPLILAFILYFMYLKGRGKSECVVALTLTVAALILVSLYLAAVNMTGSFDFDTVKNFYVDMYEAVKADFIRQMDELQSLNPGVTEPIFTEEELNLLFLGIAGQLISVLAVISFVITGVMLKAFSAIVYRFEKEPHVIVGWRFRVTNVFAYFYAALLFLNLFIGSGLGVFELAVVNLYNIFMVVFAYFGFLVAREFLSRGRGRGFASAVLIGAIILLSALAVQLLSLAGLIFTFIDNKHNRVKNDN